MTRNPRLVRFISKLLLLVMLLPNLPNKPVVLAEIATEQAIDQLSITFPGVDDVRVEYYDTSWKTLAEGVSDHKSRPALNNLSWSG